MRERVSATALALALACAACGDRPSDHPASPSSASAPVQTFTVHEWGLFGVGLEANGRAIAASSLGGPYGGEPPGTIGIGSGHGLGVSGGKPVIYVHLDPGVARAQLEIAIGIERDRLYERWPMTNALVETTLPRIGWADVVASRGPCARPLAAPAAGTPACDTRDGFCEAAEIPRYTGERDTCLTVGEAQSELLFYRADDLDARGLPLALFLGTDGERRVDRRAETRVEGPIFYVERMEADAPVRIVRLTDLHVGRPIVTDGATLTPADVRGALTEEARRRGLTQAEADAFTDAWAPAFFDARRREGPDAAGTAPRTLSQSRRSLLYFAPREAIDAMLPLVVTPPARETKRVFLVRFVDNHAGFTVHREATLGHASAPSTTPCTGACAHVTLAEPEVEQRGLSADVVRRVVRRNSAQLRYCYEQALRTSPTLEGSLTIAFIISPTGAVATTSTHAHRLRGEHAALARCAQGAFRRFVFPAPSPESAVLVRQTMTFALETR